MTDSTDRTTITVHVSVPEAVYDRANDRSESGDGLLEEYLLDDVILNLEFSTEFSTPGED